MTQILLRTSGAPAAIIVLEVEAPIRVSLPRGAERDRFLLELGRSPALMTIVAAALAAVDRDREAAWLEELALEGRGVHWVVEELLAELRAERRRPCSACSRREEGGAANMVRRLGSHGRGGESLMRRCRLKASNHIRGGWRFDKHADHSRR